MARTNGLGGCRAALKLTLWQRFLQTSLGKLLKFFNTTTLCLHQELEGFVLQVPLLCLQLGGQLPHSHGSTALQQQVPLKVLHGIQQ